MKVEVIGIRRGMSFKNDNGETVAGCKLFWTFVDENVNGVMCEAKFFNAKSPLFNDANALSPGDCVEVGYGRYGRIDSLTLI